MTFMLLRVDSTELAIPNVETLERVLADIEARARRENSPLIVDLIAPNGDRLSSGLGRDEVVMTWESHTHDPPYYVSQGTETTSDQTIEFLYDGEPTEFTADELIPRDQAFRAMLAFCETRELPSLIEWHEV
jgi:hypothetical protein